MFSARVQPGAHLGLEHCCDLMLCADNPRQAESTLTALKPLEGLDDKQKYANRIHNSKLQQLSHRIRGIDPNGKTRDASYRVVSGSHEDKVWNCHTALTES